MSEQHREKDWKEVCTPICNKTTLIDWLRSDVKRRLGGQWLPCYRQTCCSIALFTHQITVQAKHHRTMNAWRELQQRDWQVMSSLWRVLMQQTTFYLMSHWGGVPSNQSRQWVDGSCVNGSNGSLFWMGHMGHGSVHVDPWPTIILSAQWVTVKYRQKFTVNTHRSLWITIFQHSVKAECHTSVLHAVLGLATGVEKTHNSHKREFLKVHNTK